MCIRLLISVNIAIMHVPKVYINVM